MLYVVATPIGNLSDISYRAVEVLKNVKYIFAEDTRVTKKLLNHLEIDKKINQYHEHNKIYQIDNILSILKENIDVALVTDAGMPCISDPGYELVDACYKNDIKVTVIPGASSVLTAAAISGFNVRKIAYEGFLPKKKGRKTNFLKLKNEERCIIILESPNRIIRTLKEIKEYLGNRKVAVIRELTKVYEEVLRDDVDNVIKILEKKSSIKGEFVIVIEASSRNEDDE